MHPLHSMLPPSHSRAPHPRRSRTHARPVRASQAGCTARAASATHAGVTALLHAAAPPRDTLSRRVPSDARFLNFCGMFADASASQDVQTRRGVLDYFNHDIGPMLQTEESALQLLVTRLVHLKMETGWHVRFHVRRNLSGSSTTHIARDYRIRDIFSHPKGGVGMVIDPEDTSGKYASIMLFRGTASRQSRDILAKLAYPSGGRDDIHHMGVGHIGTRNLTEWFQSHTRRVLGEGRRLQLVGHSLGGAYALKLLATLTPEQQQQVHTLAFCPPGITWREAKKVVAPPQNTRIIFHRWDPVSLAGVAFPAGRFATIHDTICKGPYNIPHGLPQLSIREARGETLARSISPYTEKQKMQFNYASIVAEPVRILGGRIIRGLLRD